MIRHARAEDHRAIFEVNELAFAQPDEARLIERLRADGDVLFELVAVEDGQVTGHILFSDSWGAGHELKRMKLTHAYHASTGLFAMYPTVR